MNSIVLTPEHEYKTPAGILPSVTRILAETESPEAKERLRKWQQRFNKLEGISNLETAESARNRGSKVHDIIASYLSKTNAAIDEHDPEIATLISQARSVLELLTPVTWEQPVYHDRLGYAGTPDLIAYYRGQLTVVEWKTSYRCKRLSWIDRHLLQCAAYTQAYEWQHKKLIEGNLIVILNPERLQMFNRSSTQIKKSISEWEDRLEQYNCEGCGEFEL